MTNEPLITVALCTRNRAASLERAVRSVIPQLDADTRLVIVDNGSTDNTAEVVAALRRDCFAVHYVREERPGIPVARNRALVESTGRYVLFFDDDEVVAPDWVAAYREFLTSRDAERAGCVGGPYFPEHAIPQPAWLEPNYGFFDLHLPRQITPAGKNPVAGNCAYARETVLALGGFAENLPRHEDSELSERLRRAGHEVWWLPEARVRHLIPASRFAWRAQWNLWRADGRATPHLRLTTISSPTKRRRWLLLRFFTGTGQALLQSFLALGAILIGRRRNAARLLLRVARNGGLAAECARLLFGRGI